MGDGSYGSHTISLRRCQAAAEKEPSPRRKFPIERAVIISKGTMLNVPLAGLQPDVIPKPLHAAPNSTPAEQKSLQDLLDETEQTEILRALEASNGIIAGASGAAARLGLKRSTLQLRMQKLGIRLARTALADRGR